MPDEINPMLTTQLDQPSPEMMDAALDWLLRLAEAGPQEREAFIRWLDADPRHGLAFDRAERSWSSPATFTAASRIAERLAAEMKLPQVAARSPRPDRLPRRWSLWATAASLLLALCLGYITDLPTRVQADAITKRGEQRRLSLQDGTQVLLDSASALALDYTGSTRRARLLRGAVYFEVAKDPGRPFLLEVDGAQVRVLGTAFAVRYLNDELQVSVERGLVELSSKGKRLQLQAGEEARLIDEQLLKQDLGYQSLAWTHGRLVFANAPLEQVLDELRRYYPGWIWLTDSQLESLRVTGNYQLATPQVTLQALASMTNARLSVWPGLLILQP